MLNRESSHPSIQHDCCLVGPLELPLVPHISVMESVSSVRVFYIPFPPERRLWLLRAGRMVFITTIPHVIKCFYKAMLCARDCSERQGNIGE